jgi:glycogen synthase
MANFKTSDLNKLNDEGRLAGITNGITVSSWDPSRRENLDDFVYSANQVAEKRKEIKRE